jgi:hypothetical protein
MTLKVGNSIIVKSGIKDPDLDTDISGWQGRIAEINDDTICINWDSLTLKAMPASLIKKCEENGWEWGQMYLLESDIALAQPRDTVKDVERAVDEIGDTSAWFGLGEEGERIQKVLSGISLDDTESALEAWKRYLDSKLKFPIKATVVELLERGPLEIGDKLIIHGLHEFIDERAGILATVVYNKTDYDFPLADLEASDKRSENYQPIKDYVIWYANH